MMNSTIAQILMLAAVVFVIALLPIGQNATNISEHLSGVSIVLAI